MKKLLLGTVAAIMLTGAAQACDLSKFGPQNAFNKVELTAKDKCWLDNHAVKNYGIDGNVFWVKLEGKYYSTPVSSIVNSGKSIKIALKEWIGTEVGADLIEAQIQSDLDKQLAKAVAKGDIKTVTEIIEMKANVNVTITDGKKGEIFSTSTSEAFSYDIASEKGKSYQKGLSKGYSNAMSDMTTDGTVTPTNTMVANLDGSTGNEAWYYSVDILDSNNRVVHALGGISEMISTELATEIEGLIDAAYDAGYNDGYQAGYSQGFADGVASVK